MDGNARNELLQNTLMDMYEAKAIAIEKQNEIERLQQENEELARQVKYLQEEQNGRAGVAGPGSKIDIDSEKLRGSWKDGEFCVWTAVNEFRQQTQTDIANIQQTVDGLTTMMKHIEVFIQNGHGIQAVEERNQFSENQARKTMAVSSKGCGEASTSSTAVKSTSSDILRPGDDDPKSSRGSSPIGRPSNSAGNPVEEAHSPKLAGKKESKPEETLSVDQTRRLVELLARISPEILREQLEYKRLEEIYRAQIDEAELKKTELQKRLKTTKRKNVLETRELDRPRTVCTSEKCSKVAGRSWISEYRECHNHYNWQGETCVCGCPEHCHKMEFHETVEKTVMVTDGKYQYDLQCLVEEAEKLQNLREDEMEKFKALQCEHDTLQIFCAEATVFLQAYSPQSSVDSYMEEVQKLTRDEGIMDRQMVEASLAGYLEKVEYIRGNRRGTLASDELLKLAETLVLLPQYGEQVKQLLEENGVQIK